MDEHQIRLIFYLIVLIIVGFLIVKVFDKKRKLKLKKAKEIYSEYQVALKSNDKIKALDLGRKYYSTLRHNNRLTIYDEQAITNDLNAMS